MTSAVMRFSSATISVSGLRNEQTPDRIVNAQDDRRLEREELGAEAERVLGQIQPAVDENLALQGARPRCRISRVLTATTHT